MRRGEIFLCHNFVFADGDTARKFFVILNTPPQDKYFLAILATTKPRSDWMNYPGCYAVDGYFFIKQGTEWFPNNTWLKFNQVYDFPYTEAIDKESRGVFELKGCLSQDICNSVIGCIKMSYDITKEQISWLD